MSQRYYTNFVKAMPSSPMGCRDVAANIGTTLSGEEAQRMYLEEVKNTEESTSGTTSLNRTKGSVHERKCSVKSPGIISMSDKDLFITVQNNDVVTLSCILDKYPDKINVVDDYGWSLLMIACQANSIDITKELLVRGIDISIRDRAGNSARSLVIKNKNYVLADLLLNHRGSSRNKTKVINKVTRKEFVCKICNKTFPDGDEHLSSTIHNISASRGKKIPASYAIPQTNRGFQIMLRVGWDKDSGLGRDGTGKKYPIKVVKKEDRKGLGHEKRKTKEQIVEDDVRHNKNRKKLVKEYYSSRKFEINFRREFY